MPIGELNYAAFNYVLSTRFNTPTLQTVQHSRATEIPSAVFGVDADTVGMPWELYGFTYRVIHPLAINTFTCYPLRFTCK